MAFTLFRRTSTPTPDSTIAPYVELSEFFDDIKRTIYRSQLSVNAPAPFEVAVNTELARYAVRPGVARVVRYEGSGQIYTQDETVTGGPGGGGACTLVAPYVSPNPAGTSLPGAGDARVTVQCQQGFPPYTLVLRLEGSATVLATAVSASPQQPASFANLRPGRYQVAATDAAGCAQTSTFDVLDGNASGQPYGPDLRVTYSYANGIYRIFWNPITRQVETATIPGPYGSPNDPDYDRITQEDTPIDGYLLPDGYTWQGVYSDGRGGVYFTTTDTRKPGLLELNNLIVFHPDRPQDVTGGVLVEATATDYPLSFQLRDAAAAPLGTPNATGNFDQLSAAAYEVVVTDAQGRTLSVPFALRARYGKRWQLVSDDVDGTPWTMELWQVAYNGPVVAIQGQGEAPIVIKTDGLNSSMGGQGDVPAVVGTSCDLSLRAPYDLLSAVQLGSDRDFRVDVWRAGLLEFRGYVTPDVYSAPLLPGFVQVSLTATDGLATLKDTDFTGHIGQRLTGRRPLLNTLLHCLSRCDVALPVRIATNRRPNELPTVAAPETNVLTERAGYASLDKNEPLDMRATVEAITQLLGGTLVQRAGQWEVRSTLEAAGLTTRARTYRASGTPQAAGTIAAPVRLIVPPRLLNGQGWQWLKASQQLSIRAGWKSLAATTDAGFATNALLAGEAFGNDEAWNQSLDALLPTAGWSENAAAPGFPLVLERAGEKDTSLGALWPRRNGPEDARYLQSGQLPNAPAPEDVPWALTVVGRLVVPTPASGVVVPPPPADSNFGTLYAEVVIDGQRPVLPILCRFVLPSAGSAGDTTITTELGPLPAGAKIVRLRLYPWVPVTGLPASAVLLIKQVAIVLKPQGATWSGKDNFRADGPRGTVRPTEPVTVFHADVPQKAGLFEGAAYAFRRAVTVVGGALTTGWARPVDLQSAPLLESAAYDGLALRAAPSRLLAGAVRSHNVPPPRMLDAVDAPYDLNGRRFGVAAVAWNIKQALTDVSLVEIGQGTLLGDPDPLAEYPNGVRVLDGVTFNPGGPVTPGGGTPRVRATHHGVRIARRT